MPIDEEDSEVGEHAFALMKELVDITGEKWVAAARFHALADKTGLADPQGRVVFLTGVRALLRRMPVKVFADADVRQSILDAAQEALDAAIDLEEEQA